MDIRTAILATTAAVCGIGWLKDHVGLLAICKYLSDHDMVPPTEELRADCRFVVHRLLKLSTKL